MSIPAPLLRIAPGARLRPPADLSRVRPVVGSAPRILVLRPDHLGDLLFSGPAVAALKAAWPGSRLTLAVGPWGVPVAERLPGVDEVIAVDYPWFDRQPRRSLWAPYGRLLRAARRLRGGRFDLAVVLRDDDWWSAWLAALARIPCRVGHDRPGVGPFVTHRLPGPRTDRHAVAENLALVAALAGRPSAVAGPATAPLAFRIGDVDRVAAERLLAGAARRPLAIHPGSGALVKRWRTGAWVEVTRALAAPGETVVVTGGPDEVPLAEALASALDRPVLDLSGATDLGALAGVFERCRLVLGPDSGPLHLAVAMGTPTVHLFGPADARRFGPWGGAARHHVVAPNLPCAPCGRLDWPDPAAHPCVRTLDVARVVAAARSCEASGANL